MAKSENIFGYVLGGLAVGFLADKYLNEGAIAEEVGTQLSNSKEIIRETISQPKEYISEKIVETKEVLQDVGQNIKERVSDGLDAVKDLGSGFNLDLSKNQSSNSNNEPSLFDKIFSGINATYSVISGEHNILDRSFNILSSPVVWVKDKATNAGHSAATKTSTLYDDIKNSAQIATNSTKNLFKKTKSKATVTRHNTSSNNTKYVGSSKVRSTVIQDKNNNVVGSYNNNMKMSLNSSATKIVESSKKLSSLLGW